MKIYLFCTSGVSSSILAQSMRSAAKESEMECQIRAFSINDMKEYGQEADLILLGPQICSWKKQVERELPGKLIYVIAQNDYGRLAGKKILFKSLKRLQ